MPSPAANAAPAPVIWFIGQPNAGKTTTAQALAQRLAARGVGLEILDGNELRQRLSPELGFTFADRRIQVRRVAHLARLLSDHGIWCLVAVIAPYQALRDQAREILGSRMVEVHLRCALDILAARDHKGLYARALKGEIANFTGVSDPFEEPAAPDLAFDSGRTPVEPMVDQIMAWLAERGRL